ncbi:mCG50628 [Mus musculus]|nr:mCG50628 [Mus musculus]
MPAILSSHYLRYAAETERHNNCQGAKTAYLPCMEVHVQHACSVHTSVCACRGQRLTRGVLPTIFVR